MSNNSDYFDRVRPLLGRQFFDATVAIWNLEQNYLVAEALARTGLGHQVWFDDDDASRALCRSLGQEHAGQPAADTLAAHCRRHNPNHVPWALTSRPRTIDALRNLLSGGGVDLLLASGDRYSQALTRLAVEHGVPLVLCFVPDGVVPHQVHLVWTPDSAVHHDALAAAASDLASLAALDTEQRANHLTGLEASSTSLALCKWLLTRSLDPRPDLEDPLLRDGRCLLVRGTPGWPWSSRFLPPSAESMATIAAPCRHYTPPSALLRAERVLVVGLGTGSLMCAEAPHLFRTLVFADAKNVSAFNPVRQIYGNRSVGRFKGTELARILGRRLAPTRAPDEDRSGLVHWLTGPTHALGAVQLHLTAADPDSEQRFERILDEVCPTLAVVAMGRSRDDNFLATELLRQRGIRHITPTAFPAATHYKHILTDGKNGPCYDCLQGHLPLDASPGPTLSQAQRDLFYGGTQPATLAETLPSAHSLLRLCRDLALPQAARPAYLMRELSAERNCFVGANRAEYNDSGWLYGSSRPFSMVTFGVNDLLRIPESVRCSCGRVYPAAHR